VLGGCSAINAMIYMRGQAGDYDHWRQLGLAGWGWDDVKPIFRKQLDHFMGEGEHHGKGGEWRVEYPRLRWDITDAFQDAAAEFGIPKVSDFNTGDNDGVGYFHVNQKRGRRWSSARGFLKPALGRDNLRLETGCLAERIIFSGKRAIGVRFMQNGEPRLAHCKGEVILAAGAIGSPQLLLLSGVGPATQVNQFGIMPVLDSPGVGENLQDHLQLRLIYKVSGVTTLNETYRSLIGRAGMALNYALRRRGPLTMAPSQLGAFTRSDPDQDRPNIQYHVQPLSLDKFGDPLHPFAAFTVSVANLRPTSRGHVRLKSARPEDAPAIQPNYLSTDEDRRVAAESIRVTRKIVAEPALQRYSPFEYLPGGNVRDDDEAGLIAAAGNIGTTIFHPVGTAKMGRRDDRLAVTDERLRVIGLEGLRIADASVMPTITSGNTNSPTMMIADKAAAMIREDSRR
jgi:choline dehydrogenase-like flavoprotein